MALVILPPSVAQVLARYRHLLDERAPGLVVGLYLHGSLALGAFREGKSDVDFVATLGRPVEAHDLMALDLVHQTLARETPRPVLEGSYLQRGDLRRVGSPRWASPNYHDGRLRVAVGHTISPVDRWILRNRGIAVVGPEIVSLDVAVEWDEVAAYTEENIRTYWASWSTSPRRLAYLLTDDGIEWAVLGICRLVHGLEQGEVVSKLDAGRYALERMPGRWSRLIGESIDLGSGSRRRAFRSRVGRALEAREFIRHVVAGRSAR